MSAAYSCVGDAGFELLIEARGRVSSRQRFGVESREASFGGKGLWQGAPVDDQGTLVYSGVRSAFQGELHIRFTGKNDGTVATLTAGAVGRHAGRRSVVLRAAGILDRPASVSGVPVWLEIEVEGLRYGYRVFGLGPASLRTEADGELAGPGRQASGTTSGSIGATPEAIDATGEEGDGDVPALALFGDGGLRIVRNGKDNDNGPEEGADRAAKVQAVIDDNYRDYFSWLVRRLSTTFDGFDAEDAAQEALVWVRSHADTYDESRGSLENYLRIRARGCPESRGTWVAARW